MALKRESIHGLWSGRMAFILAATGSAVGLGNIWKFPYITGENGGGAFVLLYLFCVALIGIPIMMSEVCWEDVDDRTRSTPCVRLQMKKMPADYGNTSVGWVYWQGS